MNALAAAHPDNRLYQEYAYEHTEVIGDSETLGDHVQAESYTKRPSPASGDISSDPNDANRRSGWVSPKAVLERSKSRTAKSLPVWKTPNWTAACVGTLSRRSAEITTADGSSRCYAAYGSLRAWHRDIDRKDATGGVGISEVKGGRGGGGRCNAVLAKRTSIQ